MVRMFVRHVVRDYRIWRKAYNGFGKERRSMGVTRHAVYRSVAEPKDVTVTHDFASLAKAKAFARSPRLRQAMKAAGVRSAPVIWFAKQA
jgi:heme-degrading monooxygenase HmoA